MMVPFQLSALFYSP